MSVPLHGGHPHSGSVVTVAPELLLAFALGVVFLIALLQFLLGRYAESEL